MIKYIGSKRTLVPLITQAITRLPVDSVCDMFAGTTRVGQGLQLAGAGSSPTHFLRSKFARRGFESLPRY
jgi:hypothetical protein